jgi:hypothetical protein
MREPVGDLMTNTDFSYAPGELELFKEAVNWKAYFASQLRPFIKRRVIEVGAGIGATTAFLCDDGCGTIDSVTANGELFDSVLCIDVLEHIGNRALIVLAPAFNILFSPFDQALGHFRRYTRPQLKALT